MNLASKTILNTSLQMTAKLITLVLSTFITAYLTKILNVNQYSEYVILTALMIQLISLTEWGSGYVAVRESAKQPNRTGQIFSLLLILRVIGIPIIAVILLIMAITGTFGFPASYYLILTVPIFLTNIKNLLTSYYQTKLNFLATSIIEITTSITFAILIITVLRHDMTIETLFTLLSISIIISISSSIIIFNRKKIQISIPTVELTKQILIYSFPIGLHLLIFNLYSRIDTYILQIYHSQATVATYGLAYKIYESGLILAGLTMTSLYPILSKKGNNTNRITINTVVALGSIGLLGTILTQILASPLIMLINENYQDSIQILKLLSISFVFAYINHVSGFTLTALNKQVVFLYFAVIALALNIGLNIVFIPLYGATASAIITVITEATITISTAIYVIKHYRQITS